MLFNSFDFLLFFVVAFAVFYLVFPGLRWLWLLVCSYYFYAYWEPTYLILIVGSTLIDFIVGQAMGKPTFQKKRNLLLAISCTANLGLLFTFKYYVFFADSINAVVTILSYAPLDTPKSSLLLPVGISFYTFQTMSYTIDVYRGRIAPINHFGKFALYVSFFPQLVAGPIERAGNLLPQIMKLAQVRFSESLFMEGFAQTIFGLFKKVVVADLIALYVDSIFYSPGQYTGITLWITLYFFAFQIYCDFSGYSDIAIGTAKMLGIQFMTNFNLPYFSKSITEFWRRWHISLSTWLKDYLYISMGGNRKGRIATYRNLAITMLLGGLWHGASWNFIIWGGIHACYLVIERLVKFRFGINGLFGKLFQVVITFHLVCFSWIFFRSKDLSTAIQYFSQMFSQTYFFKLQMRDTSIFLSICINLILLISIEYFVFRKYTWQNIQNKYASLLPYAIGLLVVMIMLFGVKEGSQFIYFQF